MDVGAEIGAEEIGAEVTEETTPMVVDARAAEAIYELEMDIETGAEEGLGDAMATGASASARKAQAPIRARLAIARTAR